VCNLRDALVVREVRGLGLLVGIELRRKAAPFLQVLMEDGVVPGEGELLEKAGKVAADLAARE